METVASSTSSKASSPASAYNEDRVQPTKPTESGIPGLSVDDAIVAGLHRVTASGERPPQVRLLVSGPAVPTAQQAAEDLASSHGISAEVWSVTSWKQLRDDALTVERWPRENPGIPPRTSHLLRALGDRPIPVVAVSDYVSALPDQLARFIGAPFVSLGTDGYGISDTREELRAHFGVDANGISAAARRVLLAAGQDAAGPAVTTTPSQNARPSHGLVA